MSCGSGGDKVIFLSNHAVKQMAVQLKAYCAGIIHEIPDA